MLICIAHRLIYLQCAQTWITQFYLQIIPCLPSHRASPPFGWYPFYRPTEGRRLSQPGDDISETVQDRDMVAMKSNRKSYVVY